MALLVAGASLLLIERSLFTSKIDTSALNNRSALPFFKARLKDGIIALIKDVRLNPSIFQALIDGVGVFQVVAWGLTLHEVHHSEKQD